MNKVLFLAVVIAFIGCRPKPFEVRPALPTKAYKIENSENVFKDEIDPAQKELLIERYKKAQSPTFGIIDGYYRLPNAKPFGAAKVVKGYSYGSYIESMQIEGREQPFALSPLSGDDAIALSKSLNALLDMGVKIKEISMSDALHIAKEEEHAYKSNHPWVLGKSLPLSVDLLMSINRATSERGPILVGRVLSKDGRLLAFRVLYNAKNPSMFSSLVISLFEDSINRL